MAMSENITLVTGRMGSWVESEIVGVECPFCKEWSHFMLPRCPNKDCDAILRGLQRRRPALIGVVVKMPRPAVACNV